MRWVAHLPYILFSFNKLPFPSTKLLSVMAASNSSYSVEPVVIDSGSELLKYNHASRSKPEVIPTKMKRVPDDEFSAIAALCGDLTVDSVVRGFIRDWDAMEDLLCDVLYERLGWKPGNEGQILSAEPLRTPHADRERLVQLLFENFHISGFYASEQAVLSLYAHGRTTGSTVDIGHGKLDIAAVIEGAVQSISSRRFELGGLDLTNLFAQELRKSNPSVNFNISDVEELKKVYACCSKTYAAYKKVLQKCPVEQHTLPDGQVIKIKGERFTVGEALFRPSVLGVEVHGIVEQLIQSILSVPANYREHLENTVLCGGTVSMAGFEKRFQEEASFVSPVIQPTLMKRPDYMEDMTEWAAWVGGAIIARFWFNQHMHMTRADYNEHGPNIVHRKCIG